jgi:integrase
VPDIEISRGEVYRREWHTGGKTRSAYQFSFTVTRDGVTRRVRGQAPTRAEATTEMERRKGLERNPPASKTAAPTVNDYADAWLKRIATEISPRTLENYRDHLKLYVRPAIGTLAITEVRRSHVRDVIVAMRAKGLSKNTARLCRAAMSVLFADAVDAELIEVNPAVGAVRRGRDKSSSVSATERRQGIRALSIEELELFLETARRGAGVPGRQARIDQRDYLIYLTLADTGMRPSECLALKWEDLDLVGRTVVVERAMDKGGKVKPTKTGETRRIDLTARLADALGAYQAQLEADALAADREPSPWLFTADGKLMDRNNGIGRKFRQLIVRAGLPSNKLYVLRHSYASHLLAAGAPITYVAAQLGHAKPVTTLSYYAHWIPRGDRGQVDRLEAARAAAHGRAHGSVAAAVSLTKSFVPA